MPKGKYKRKPHTEVRKISISESMKGRKHTLEARRNMSKAKSGNHLKHSGQFQEGHIAWNKKNKKDKRETKRYNGKIIPKSNYVYIKYHQLDKIPDGFVVHHIDENPNNNDIRNLRLMREEDHHFFHSMLDSERYRFSLAVKKLKEEDIQGLVKEYEEGKINDIDEFAIKLVKKINKRVGDKLT